MPRLVRAKAFKLPRTGRGATARTRLKESINDACGQALFISGGRRGIDLAAEGVTNFDRYACQPGAEPQADLFVDHA